jgi:hypothetical protein
MILPTLRSMGTVLAVAGGLIGGGGEAQGAPPLNPNGPITMAEATAYAHVVNLGVADVPGMVSISLEGEHNEGPPKDEAVCGVRESHVHVVDVHSPRFESGEGFELAEVESEVEVMPTAALAARKLAQGRPLSGNAVCAPALSAPLHKPWPKTSPGIQLGE